MLLNKKAKATRKCHFSGCHINEENRPAHVQLHRVPKEPMLRAIWLEKMGVRDASAKSANMYICSLHIPDRNLPKNKWIPIAGIKNAWQADSLLRDASRQQELEKRKAAAEKAKAERKISRIKQRLQKIDIDEVKRPRTSSGHKDQPTALYTHCIPPAQGRQDDLRNGGRNEEGAD